MKNKITAITAITAILLPLLGHASVKNEHCLDEMAQGLFEASQNYPFKKQDILSVYKQLVCGNEITQANDQLFRSFYDTRTFDDFHSAACDKNRVSRSIGAYIAFNKSSNQNSNLKEVLPLLDKAFHKHYASCIEDTIIYQQPYVEPLTCQLKYSTNPATGQVNHRFVDATVRISENMNPINMSNIEVRGMRYSPTRNMIKKRDVGSIKPGKHTISYQVKINSNKLPTLTLQGRDKNGNDHTHTCGIGQHEKVATSLNPSQVAQCDNARKKALRNGWINHYDYIIDTASNMVPYRIGNDHRTDKISCHLYVD